MAEFGLPDSLLKRLTLVYALAFTVFLSIAFAILYLSIASTTQRQMDEELREDAEEYTLVFRQGGLAALIDEVERDAMVGDASDDFIQLFDEQGQRIFSSDLQHWQGLSADRSALSRIADHGTDEILTTLQLQSQEADTRVIYARLSDDRLLFLGESLEAREEMLESLPFPFVSVFVASVLLASTLVAWVTRHSIRGITRVSEAAESIRAGNLDHRIRGQGQPTELQVLADTFDAMAGRIQSLVLEMRNMTDNIAHDLRSPLSRIRVICESALTDSDSEASLKQAAEGTISECDRLIHLINLSLDVSEAEAGVSRGQLESVDLSEMCEAACELFETVAETRGVSLIHTLDPNCQVLGIPEALQRMLANVLDNAIKFTLEDGRIEVLLESRQSSFLLSVSDTGIGMPEAQRQRIFDRFYRGDNSRSFSGCGLGLSYSRAVARNHGGDITVKSVEGKGSCFTISLPMQSVRDSMSTSNDDELMRRIISSSDQVPMKLP